MLHVLQTIFGATENFLAPENFAVNVMSVLGHIAGIGFTIVIGVLLFKFFFGRTMKLLRGPGYKIARRVLAASFTVPLLTFWIHRVIVGEADGKQWAVFILLWLLIQYIPVNLFQHVFSENAENHEKAMEFKRFIRERTKMARKKNREFQKMMREKKKRIKAMNKEKERETVSMETTAVSEVTENNAPCEEASSNEEPVFVNTPSCVNTREEAIALKTILQEMVTFAEQHENIIPFRHPSENGLYNDPA